MTYVIWSFQRCTKSQVQHNDWEKWFQTLVVTALITYSALSPFLLSLALPSSLPLFSSVSCWLHSMARHLSRCHPPYGFPLSLSLCEAMETGFFCSVFLSTSFSFTHPTSLALAHLCHWLLTISGILKRQACARCAYDCMQLCVKTA